MVRMVHEATIFCNTSTGGASPVGTAATWTGTGVTLALHLVPSLMGDWLRVRYEYESLRVAILVQYCTRTIAVTSRATPART